MRVMTRSMVIVAAMVAAFAPLVAQDRQDARVILISIDGLMPSSYTMSGSQVPNLRMLARDGVWAEGVIGVLPTVTFPSHTTLITGVEPAVHGIVDNRILDPENRSDGAWFYYARDIKVPTLPMAARARGLRAAAVTWPATVGMDLDYVVPEYFRSDHEENLSMLKALTTPRTLLEAVENTRGKTSGWPQTDRDRTDTRLDSSRRAVAICRPSPRLEGHDHNGRPVIWHSTVRRIIPRLREILCGSPRSSLLCFS